MIEQGVLLFKGLMDGIRGLKVNSIHVGDMSPLHTCYGMQTCVVQRSIKNVVRKQSWCGPCSMLPSLFPVKGASE